MGRRAKPASPSGKAIPDGLPSTRCHNRSNIKGVVKWTVDGEKCFRYWVAQNSD